MPDDPPEQPYEDLLNACLAFLSPHRRLVEQTRRAGLDEIHIAMTAELERFAAAVRHAQQLRHPRRPANDADPGE